MLKSVVDMVKSHFDIGQFLGTDKLKLKTKKQFRKLLYTIYIHIVNILVIGNRGIISLLFTPIYMIYIHIPNW